MKKKNKKLEKQVVGALTYAIRRELSKRIVKAIAKRFVLLGAFPISVITTYFARRVLEVIYENSEMAFKIAMQNKEIEKEFKRLREVVDDEEMPEKERKEAFVRFGSDFLSL